MKYGNYITFTENGPPSELTTDTFHDKSMGFHHRCSRRVLAVRGGVVQWEEKVGGSNAVTQTSAVFSIRIFGTRVMQGQLVVAYVPE